MPLLSEIKTRDKCPNCDADLTNSPEGDSSDFCYKCRFPLLIVANKYRLMHKLTEGGFAILYAAEHIHLERDARRVIKVIKPEYLSNENMRARFVREVQVTSALSQRNNHIVRIYDDFGEINNLGYFYVMEHLEGKPLNDMLDAAQGILSLELCYHLFLQLCDAMREAHNASIVHRDLKPHNIYIIEQGRDSHFLKVIDFGIAKPIGNQPDQVQVTQGILGTPAYMSPEQCVNRNVSAASDIYAMGIILYELLTGETPFVPRDPAKQENLSVMEIMSAHLNTSPPPLHSKMPPNRLIPWEMEGVIQRALAKRPDERFQNVEEMEKAFLQTLPDTRHPGTYLTGMHILPELTPRTPAIAPQVYSAQPALSYPGDTMREIPVVQGEYVSSPGFFHDMPSPVQNPSYPLYGQLSPYPPLVTGYSPTDDFDSFGDSKATEVAVETVSSLAHRDPAYREQINFNQMPPGHFSPAPPPAFSLPPSAEASFSSMSPIVPMATPKQPTDRDFRRKVIEIDRRQEPQRNVPSASPPTGSPLPNTGISSESNVNPSRIPLVERNPIPAIQRASDSLLPAIAGTLTPTPYLGPEFSEPTPYNPSLTGINRPQPRTTMRTALRQNSLQRKPSVQWIVFFVLLVILGFTLYATRHTWQPLLQKNTPPPPRVPNSSKLDLPTPPSSRLGTVQPTPSSTRSDNPPPARRKTTKDDDL